VSSMEITKRARGEFDPAQVDLIRQTVAKNCNDGELALFLETCARHDLDPIIKQIWTIKINGTMQPVVSRDGLLAIANRYTGAKWDGLNGEFLGCASNVLHEYDEFSFSYRNRDDGTQEVVIEHSPKDKDGKATHGGPNGDLRGPIVAAWSRVRRRGHDDVFYLAYREEYDKKQAVWKSHPHAMMVKVPETMALRKAFSVSGVVGETELIPKEQETVTATTDAVEAVIEWPADEQLVSKLKSAFVALGYTTAKVRLMVNGRTDDELYELVNDLNREADEGLGEVIDAEVVSE